MINNREELHQAVECLESMFRAMAALKAEEMPRGAAEFAVLAEGPLEQIRQLHEQIDAYTGESLAQRLSADVWMHITGAQIRWPDSPTSVLTAILDAMRKGLQTAAEVIAGGQPTTRPTGEIRRACDLQVVAFQAGSLQVGLALPPPEEPSLPLDMAPPLGRQALEEYLSVAAWAGGTADPAEIEKRIQDPSRRRALLNALEPLVPRPHGAVDSIEISGRALIGRDPVQLTRATRARIDAAIDRAVGRQTQTHVGVLREIDLDKLSFILRSTSAGQNIRCKFNVELTEPAKDALDQRVRVTGTQQGKATGRSGGQLHVTRLQIEDSDEAATSDPGVSPHG